MCEECELGPDESVERRILHDLGYFGHFLFTRRGGRGGKQHVLKTLYKAGGQMPQRDLLERTSTTSAALSEVLGKLEAEGLVTRERSERDKRQLVISLTDEGDRRSRDVCLSKEEFEREAFACLTEEERLELLAMADRIYNHWNKIERTEKGDTACSRS